MKFQPSHAQRLLAVAGLLTLGLAGTSASFGQASLNISIGIPVEAPPPPPPPPPPPMGPRHYVSPGVENIIRLSKAGIREDIILAEVRNLGPVYLNPNQIIYLNNEGVSANVINALVESGGGAPVYQAPAPEPTAPPTQVSYDYFHDQLAPYGTWVQLPDYGWAWRPNAALGDASWRPYGDAGHWVYTSAGLYWQSEYPWGDIPFHYGRWTYSGSLGWLWLPAYNWAPAWVSWRHAEGCTGWAPLSPEAVFVAGVGLQFHGRVALDIDFGIPAESFVFVSYDHMWDHGYHDHFMPRERADYFYGHSEVHNGYHFEGGQIRVEGIGRERLAAATHHEIHVEDARTLRTQQEKTHFAARRADPVVHRYVQAHPKPKVPVHARDEKARAGEHPGSKPGEHAKAEKDSRAAAKPEDRAKAEKPGHPGAGNPEHPGAKPEERAAKPGERPEAKPSAKPEEHAAKAEKPGHPGAKPEEHAAKPGEKPGVKPGAKPAGKPAVKPEAKPKPKVVEKPNPDKDKKDQQP